MLYVARPTWAPSSSMTSVPVALILALSVAQPAAGSTVSLEIPWTLSVPVPNTPAPGTTSLPVSETEGTFQTASGGLRSDTLGLRALFGLDINAEAVSDSFMLNLPLTYKITAPQVVQPGQLVSVQTEVALTPTSTNPIAFSISGEAALDTALRYDVAALGASASGSLDLPDNISKSPFSLQTANSGSFETEYDGDPVEEVLSRSYFTEDSLGNFLAPKATSFVGLQLSAEDTIDGIEGSVDIYDPVAVATGVLAPTTPVIDLTLDAGVDLQITNTLSTNLATAFYTDDGVSSNTLLMNRPVSGLGGGPQIRIPDNVTAGETYQVNFFGLGLGFNVLTELGLVGSFDIELESDVPLLGGSVNLLDLVLTDPRNFDRALTRYYVSTQTPFSPNFAATSLFFTIADECDPTAGLVCSVAGTGPETPTVLARDDAFFDEFDDLIPSPTGVVAGTDLASDAPVATPVVEVAPSVIPLPASAWGLLAGLAALGALRGVRHRRDAV